MVDNRIIAGIVVIGILLGAGTATYLFLNNPFAGEDTPPQNLDYVDLNATFTILDSQFYKGENLNFSLGISVNDSTKIYHLNVSIHDPVRQRDAVQLVKINKVIPSGNSTLTDQLQPAFADKGFVSLTNQTYTITEFSILYQSGGNTTTSFQTSIPLNGSNYPIYEQANHLNWNVSAAPTGINITTINNQIWVESTSSEMESVLLNTTIQTKGYTRIVYNYTASNSSTNLHIGDQTKDLDSNGYLPIGNLMSEKNLLVSINVSSSDSVNLNLSISTKKIVITAVLASNNWAYSSGDSNRFRAPSFYVKQASHRFEDVFNVTILPVLTVPFKSNQSTNLFDLIIEAQTQVGEELSLPNGEWTLDRGIQSENAGADILLVFTNKTMDHLGIVIGTRGEPFNMAVHARGSLNTGNYRLTSSLADNLIQHEISHIFGAPDRFTDSSPPSIMTKSKPEDAAEDIIFNRFWLFRKNWLEEDIQTMVDNVDLYE